MSSSSEGLSGRGPRPEPGVTRRESERAFVRSFTYEGPNETFHAAPSPVSAGVVSVPELPELRVGRWTRLGVNSVLGDAVTESLLDGIATEAREAAQAQGYAVGWAAGRRAAAEQASIEDAARRERDAAEEERREVAHRAGLAALGEAAEQVRGLLGDLTDAIEAQTTDLAFALCAELVGIRVASLGPADVVARVLQVLPAAPVGRVRLHPSLLDADAVRDLAAHGLEVIGDAGLGPADALVESGDGAVTDLRINDALARVREVLS